MIVIVVVVITISSSRPCLIIVINTHIVDMPMSQLLDSGMPWHANVFTLYSDITDIMHCGGQTCQDKDGAGSCGNGGKDSGTTAPLLNYTNLCAWPCNIAVVDQISDFAVKLQFSTSETVSVSEALRKLVQEKEKAWKSAYEDQDIPKIPKAVAVGGMSCMHFCSRIQHDHTRIT